MSTNSSDQFQPVVSPVSEIIETEIIELEDSLSTVVTNETPIEKVKKKDAVKWKNVKASNSRKQRRRERKRKKESKNREIDATYASPFAFITEELVSLISEKDLPKLKKFGGIEGIIKGLQSDATAGLSVDETASLGPVRLQELEGDRKEKLVDAVVGPAKQPISNLIPADGTPFSQRKAVFGTNVLPARKPKSIFLLMWIAMKEKILVLLTVAAIVSLSLGLYEDFGTHKEGPKVSWVEGVAIIVAILIVVLVGSINDWQKELQFQKLNAKKEDKEVKVIRSGKEELISVHDLLWRYNVTRTRRRHCSRRYTNFWTQPQMR